MKFARDITGLVRTAIGKVGTVGMVSLTWQSLNWISVGTIIILFTTSLSLILERKMGADCARGIPSSHQCSIASYLFSSSVDE